MDGTWEFPSFVWRHILDHLPSSKLVLQSHSYGNKYGDTDPILTFSLSPFPFAENIPSPVVSIPHSN